MELPYGLGTRNPEAKVRVLPRLALTSKGIVGVSHTTLVILLAAAGSLHVPASAVFMLLGVDTLVDMGRTAMNVVGNRMAAAVAARWEQDLLRARD
ncbi:MAG: cation:dicarboxylase symporter family transporter [Terracidiphilus sp.]